jgi:hypothetical protein
MTTIETPPGSFRKSQPSRKREFLLFLLLFAFMIIPRWYYVDHFAVALPFMDQWDAEWDGLLQPWIHGNLHFTDLFKAHNEHRIFPTRLLTLLSYELSGVWNNRTEAMFNVPLGVATPLLLIWLLFRMGELRGTRWMVAAVIIAGAILPFSWENMLIGFQSQFYFLNLFTLAGLALVVCLPANTWTMSAVLALCIVSVVTMASGLLTPAAVAVVYCLQAYWIKKWTSSTFLMIGLLLILALSGYLTMPYVAGHQVLRAKNLTELFTTIIRVFGWPLTDRKLYIGILWLPALIIVPTMVKRRLINRCDLLMTGCFVWTGMQVLALSYGRGSALYTVSSRYTDVLLLGLAANAWFVLRATEAFHSNDRIKTGLKIIAVIFFSAIFISYKRRYADDISIMKSEKETRLIQTKNVYGYLKTRDKALLQQPPMHIPYPNAKRMQDLLDNPRLPPVLPVYP